jgi:CubicO group peptidase (beta-lactamase class C family)
MMTSKWFQLFIASAVATTTAVAAARSSGAGVGVDAQIDRVFARWTTSSPGCAAGAAVDGKPVLAKGYGMADLEHDVKITPDTIFEAGSVSKQFTAAAMLLLAGEGKLSLDDPARKYLPELPDYGSSLTIRHMLNHTSGLRDWGSIEAIAGWPRGSRTYTHAHVLEIVSRQRALNFVPGTKWSYSNTGYNLAAIIVSRVSGTAFADFTRQRLFEPLGMTHTSWRDDYTRIVRNRAIAYSERDGWFHTNMPFENVYGNGGLLTTVGDLLKWNENFSAPKVGDAAFVALQQQPGRFNDGRAHNYAFGLTIGTTKGGPVVEHSGSTAGYSAHLLRYPDQHVSVAVLCNASTARAVEYAHEVADLYLGDRGRRVAEVARDLPRDGDSVYRHVETGVVLTPPLSGSSWRADGNGRIRVTDPFGTVDVYERVAKATPTVDQLRELAGPYVSDEAEATLTAAVEGQSLVLKRRPDTTLKLAPLYADAFSAPQLGLVVFRRDASGRVSALSIVQDRVWDLRFTRQGQPMRSSQGAK